jgi:hypothetical protein
MSPKPGGQVRAAAAETKHVPNFVAKLIAGGLSAAVILVWWPAFFPADTVASWLARGVIWTLAFELFTYTFTPLERALWETAPGRRLRTRALRQGGGLPLGRSATLACSALVVVAFLLTLAPEQTRKRAAARTTQVTEVHRVVRVVRRPVEVTRVVSAPRTPARSGSAPAPVAARPAAPADHPAPRTAPAPRRQQQPASTQAPVSVPEAAAPAMDGQAELTPAPRQQSLPKLATRS